MNFTIFDPGSGYVLELFKILQAAENKALAGFYFIPTPPFCSTFGIRGLMWCHKAEIMKIAA